jgi:hypothetical protein
VFKDASFSELADDDELVAAVARPTDVHNGLLPKRKSMCRLHNDRIDPVWEIDDVGSSDIVNPDGVLSPLLACTAAGSVGCASPLNAIDIYRRSVARTAR